MAGLAGHTLDLMSYQKGRPMTPYRMHRLPRLYRVMGVSLTAGEIWQVVGSAVVIVAALPCFWLLCVVLMAL